MGRVTFAKNLSQLKLVKVMKGNKVISCTSVILLNLKDSIDLNEP